MSSSCLLYLFQCLVSHPELLLVHPILCPGQSLFFWLMQGEGLMASWYWRVYGTVNIKIKPHNLYSNIPCMTCKVHVHPVFLLCWPVNQVNYNKSTRSTGWKWMGKLNKSSTAISHIWLVKYTFILCSYFLNQSTRSTTISQLGWPVNNEWQIDLY